MIFTGDVNRSGLREGMDHHRFCWWQADSISEECCAGGSASCRRTGYGRSLDHVAPAMSRCPKPDEGAINQHSLVPSVERILDFLGYQKAYLAVDFCFHRADHRHLTEGVRFDEKPVSPPLARHTLSHFLL
ncbi:hypothetical protein J6590_001554 [Homalodisca vitripennis]|nr:hypothetical protein J6590_001554 [Homalodisca vitripennis]